MSGGFTAERHRRCRAFTVPGLTTDRTELHGDSIGGVRWNSVDFLKRSLKEYFPTQVSLHLAEYIGEFDSGDVFGTIQPVRIGTAGLAIADPFVDATARPIGSGFAVTTTLVACGVRCTFGVARGWRCRRTHDGAGRTVDAFQKSPLALRRPFGTRRLCETGAFPQ